MLKLPVIALGTVLACGAAFAADEHVDYDHSTNFERYQTYTWLRVQASSSLWEDRIRQDVDQELSSKGWKRVDNGGDASVAAVGATRNQTTLRTFYDNFGGGWYWRGFGSGMSTTTTDVTPVGSLVVDLFDSSSKKLIWRATVSEALSDKPEKNVGKLEKSVKKIFDDFPPKPQSK